MSHWDGKQMHRWPSQPVEGYPEWERVDCGCCAGLEWSVAASYPRECDDCMGTGWRCVHKPTGTVALYPGGPLLGAHKV